MTQHVEGTALHLRCWLQLLYQFLLQLGLGAKGLPWQPVCSSSFTEFLALEKEQQMMLVVLAWLKGSKRIAFYKIWFQQHRKCRSSGKESGNCSLLYFLNTLISGKGIKRIAVSTSVQKMVHWLQRCAFSCLLPALDLSCHWSGHVFCTPSSAWDRRRISLCWHRGHVRAEREIPCSVLSNALLLESSCHWLSCLTL